MHLKKTLLHFLLLPFLVKAWPDTEVTSREYKTMLQSSIFEPGTTTKSTTTGSSSSSTTTTSSSSSRHEDILKELQHDLSLAAAAAGAVQVKGDFVLKSKTPRHVQFWDTPGKCHLRNNGWTLRMRRSLGSEKEELPWEGTLKSRSGDRYHTSYRRKHMNECHSDFKQGHSKLEEDIPHFDWTGNMFSFSQKCDIPAPEHPLRSLQHVIDVWYEMETNIVDLEWDLEAKLHLVSNLTMIEVVYEDFWIDFDTGDDDEMAEVKVTLWYHDSEDLYNSNHHSNQSTSGDEDNSRLILMESLKQQPPVLAEMSYTIQSKKEKWSETTIMRAHSLWDQCSNLDRWLDPKSSTKTAWMYRYDAAFCDAKNVEGESA